jgi:hypothetical protein
MGKQTKITIETHTLLVLRGGALIRLWCERCGAEVEMIQIETARVVSNLRPFAIEEWINSRDLHRSCLADGQELVCLNSLLWLTAIKKK